ncbi:MAG TPA: C-GCAxxG-C-C family protein [Phycisphaerae bacterium]|nr:C-GCAxxG-C-C family protein [Phycisphaerae bacterium]HRY66833.1 C-GCAxxG-C-C family protein [Phycisphaerae bacterium]HSA26891.1 C-GCAxxG-C-C family protein [Phycisphaerae bacterium]
MNASCNRRAFLGAAGAALGSLTVSHASESTASRNSTTGPSSQPTTRPDLGNLAAKNLGAGGQNCAEAMLAAALEYLDQPRELVSVASLFGGGMGMGDHCGYFCGGLMTLGLACAGRPDGKVVASSLRKTFIEEWKKTRPLRCREIKEAHVAGKLAGNCADIGKDAGATLAKLIAPIIDHPKRVRFARRS